MTNSEVRRYLRSIDRHNDRVIKMIDRIEESGRKDGVDIAEALREQCAQFACAEAVCEHFLVKRDGR